MIQATDSARQYSRVTETEIGECEILTYADQKAIYRQYAAGDKNATDRLVRSQYRMVVSIACRMRITSGLPRSILPDLISAGTVGLMKSLAKWDPEMSRLQTYAWRGVAWAVKRAIEREKRQSRVGTHDPAVIQAMCRTETDCVVDDACEHSSMQSLREAATTYRNGPAILQMHLEGRTYAEIGGLVGMSRQRCQQVIASAVNQVRRSVRAEVEA